MVRLIVRSMRVQRTVLLRYLDQAPDVAYLACTLVECHFWVCCRVVVQGVHWW